MAKKAYEDNVLHWTADAAYSAGTLIQHDTGKIGVLVNDVESGDECALEINCQVEVDNSGVSFAAGATVGYDQSDDDAVAGGGGDFDIGKAVNAAGTSAKVLVLLD